jgi:hypothetical protein
VLVFRFEDPDLALQTLQGSAVSFIDTVDLFGRLDRV